MLGALTAQRETHAIERGGHMAATTATGSLSFDRIGMVFDDGTEAIREVSFTVEKGEFVTVVGPSGCGKSTLLKIASGLLEPTRGTVAVDRDRLGYVFQDPTLLPWRTVQQNVELLPELHGVAKRERQAQAARAIATVGLKGFEGHFPKALSGGMRMRCSLARTLTLNPPLFLFDEPFGAVDEITREHLNEETQRLFVSEGFAGLFITHSISEAAFLSTRVLVMSARPGRVVAEFDVPFPYPRNPDLRFQPEFAKLSGQISHALRGAHA
jgi:NitT/TauT family transport system ATP-binding protein